MLIVSMIEVLIMYDVLQNYVTMKVIVITNPKIWYSTYSNRPFVFANPLPELGLIEEVFKFHLDLSLSSCAWRRLPGEGIIPSRKGKLGKFCEIIFRPKLLGCSDLPAMLPGRAGGHHSSFKLDHTAVAKFFQMLTRILETHPSVVTCVCKSLFALSLFIPPWYLHSIIKISNRRLIICPNLYLA